MVCIPSCLYLNTMESRCNMSEVKQDILVCVIGVFLMCTSFFIMGTIKRTDYYTSMPTVELEHGDNIDAYIHIYVNHRCNNSIGY